MAKKRRIAAKDLQSIRENFRAEKLNSDVEQPNINKQIAAAKTKARDIKVYETGMTPKEIKKAAKNKIKNIKADFSNTQSAKAVFNFEVGDIVCFNFNGKEEIGLICNMWVPKSLNTQAQAKNAGNVTLLSSVGRVDVKPMSIYKKINECN